MKLNVWLLTLSAFAGMIASLSLLMGAPGGIPGPPPKAPKVRPNHPPPPQPSPTPTLSGFGAIIANLQPNNKADWGVGRTQFQTPEDVPGGLGVIFNSAACVNCHSSPDLNLKPTVGGASSTTETRFETLAGIFDLLHQSSITPAAQDTVPAGALVVAHRLSTPLFGVGFLEAIPDSAIIANANTPQKDGVHGRVAMLTDPLTIRVATGAFFNGSPNRIGRFGWKNQESSLIAFAFDAAINELGETNRGFGTDFAPHVAGGQLPDQAALVAAEPPGLTPTTLQDLPVDETMPEGPTNKDDADRYHDFLRFNAVPPQLPLTASALKGQQIFTQKLNCVACHKASMQTGVVADEPQLSLQTIFPYTDLLLHHMGTAGDGIVQQAAGADEMRTAPLWGLRARQTFLHAGNASTISAAIEAHDAPGAESQIAGQRFKKLNPAEVQELLDFLNSI
jgi:CxxC motif-containing protein (DUF1111 family)